MSMPPSNKLGSKVVVRFVTIVETSKLWLIIQIIFCVDHEIQQDCDLFEQNKAVRDMRDK